MRHNRDEKRFDRTASHLKSMLASMTNALVMTGRIKTTTQRAKVFRRFAERMITLGKDGTVAARRRAMAFMNNKAAVTRLFDEVAPQYKERHGGYTRIMKLGIRPGDSAAISIVELVESGTAAETKPKAKKTAKPKAQAKKAAPAKKPAEKKAAKPASGEEKPKRAPRKKAAAAEA